MDSRERVRRAVRFGRPDVPPLLHGIVGGRRAHDAAWAQTIHNQFPEDFGIEDDNELAPVDAAYFTRGEPFVGVWGCTRQCLTDGLQSSVIVHPLADWRRFDAYRAPVPQGEPWRELDQRIRRGGHPRYVCVGLGGFFTTMQALRGMESLFCDFHEDLGRVRALADLVFGIFMQNVRFVCDTEADGVHLADDWGTETALMVSPGLWRTFFKPYYASAVACVRQSGKDVWLHCCGQVREIVPDFLELGVHVLHPQMEMLMEDPTFLPTVRGRLCLETDIDRNFLCVAEPDAVYRRTLGTFRKVYQPEGGMVLRGEIGISVPQANAEAFYRACADFQDEVR